MKRPISGIKEYLRSEEQKLFLNRLLDVDPSPARKRVVSRVIASGPIGSLLPARLSIENRKW